MLLTALAAQELQKSYEVYDSSIYSTDLVPSCDRRFFLFHIPQGQTKYQHPSYEIVQMFQQFGCEIESVDFARVEFTLAGSAACLKQDLKNHFKNLYPSLKVEDIFIQINRNFDCDAPYMVDNIPNRERGSMVIVQDSNRYFFRYEITASIKRYVSTTTIERGAAVDGSNSQLQYVKFTDLHRDYLQDISNVVARHRIQEGRNLMQQMVQQTPDVRRGHSVKCRLRQDNVVIEFEAEAMSDGVIGDEIRLQKGLDRFRGRIIGKNLVEIL